MIVLLIVLQMLSVRGWSAEQVFEALHSQLPSPIGADFSVPSIGETGLNLAPQFDIQSQKQEAFLSAEDALLKNDPLLGQDRAARIATPVSLTPASGQSQLPTGRVRAVESRSKQKNSFIKVNSFSELKQIVSSAGNAHGVQSAQVQWDGATAARKNVERASERTPLTARGPPEITVVHNAAEVDRAIPDTPTLRQFREQLKEKFWRKELRSIRVYSYLGATGGRITTVDVSHSPSLVEILPGLRHQEKKLIETLIASGAKQVQVILIEGESESKTTPDLILNGRMAEMKSVSFALADIIHDLPLFLNKANSQLYEYAERHGFDDGTVVMDMSDEDYGVDDVPVGDVLLSIATWEKIPVGEEVPSPYPPSKRRSGKLRKAHPVIRRPIAVDRIEIFARHDHKVFTRRADGSFGLEGSIR